MRRSVLVVDDHASFRVAASALLRAEGFDVVGEASDGGSAVALARLLVPDIVLLDVQLPEIDGFAVAVRLSELADPPAVVLVKSRDATTYGAGWQRPVWPASWANERCPGPRSRRCSSVRSASSPVDTRGATTWLRTSDQLTHGPGAHHRCD